jgi:hypothetical protein
VKQTRLSWCRMLPSFCAVLLVAAGCTNAKRTTGNPSNNRMTKESQVVKSSDGRITVSYARGTLSKAPTFSPASSPTDQQIPAGFNQLGAAFDIDTEGQQPADPVIITARLDTKIAAEYVPVIATWKDDSWENLPTTFDRVTHVVSARTTHFSRFALFAIDGRKLADSVFATLTGAADRSAIECPDVTFADGYRALLPNAGDAFSACGETVGGELILRLKNRRQGSFLIQLPPGWTGEVEGAAKFCRWCWNSARLSNRKSRDGPILKTPGSAPSNFRSTDYWLRQ